MATDFDLDIDNYTIKDLEKFFSLTSQRNKYSQVDVERREAEIREQFMTSGHIDRRFKADFIAFLTTAKRRLMEISCIDSINKKPTTIPKNWQLDPIPIPYIQPPPPRTDELVDKEHANFIYTSAGEFFQGTLNPLDKRILTRNICIDTIFRKNYITTKSTDFTYSLPKTMHNVLSMQITSFEFPKTWYSISKDRKNNIFTIVLSNMLLYDDVAHPIIIPDGTYTFAILRLYLNTYFLDTRKGLEYIYVDDDPITRGIVFRTRTIDDPWTDGEIVKGPFIDGSDYSPTFSFTLDFIVEDESIRPLYKNIGWIMGFRRKWYTVNITNTLTRIPENILYICAIKSEAGFEDSNNRYIFVEIDDFHNNFPTDTIISINGPGNAFIGKNIIARIMIDGINDGTAAIDNAGDRIFKSREFFGPINIEKFKIRILDRFGDVINLQGGDYSIVIELKQLY